MAFPSLLALQVLCVRCWGIATQGSPTLTSQATDTPGLFVHCFLFFLLHLEITILVLLGWLFGLVLVFLESGFLCVS